MTQILAQVIQFPMKKEALPLPVSGNELAEIYDAMSADAAFTEWWADLDTGRGLSFVAIDSIYPQESRPPVGSVTLDDLFLDIALELSVEWAVGAA